MCRKSQAGRSSFGFNKVRSHEAKCLFPIIILVILITIKSLACPVAAPGGCMWVHCTQSTHQCIPLLCRCSYRLYGLFTHAKPIKVLTHCMHFYYIVIVSNKYASKYTWAVYMEWYQLRTVMIFIQSCSSLKYKLLLISFMHSPVQSTSF